MREVPGRPEDAERVEPQPRCALQPPVEHGAEHDRQPFHAVERAARREGEGRARVGGAEGVLGAEVAQAAPQVRRVGERIAHHPVAERLAVLAHLAAGRAGGAADRPAHDQHGAGDFRAGVEDRVAVDHQQRALDSSAD